MKNISIWSLVRRLENQGWFYSPSEQVFYKLNTNFQILFDFYQNQSTFVFSQDQIENSKITLTSKTTTKLIQEINQLLP